MIRGVYYGDLKDNKKKEIPGIYYDNIEIESLPGEQWLPVFESVIPGVKPYYYVSNKGRIYSTQYKNGKGGFKSTKESKYGYVPSGLMKQDGKMSSEGVHRVEMMTFNPIPNYENLVVNHKDGNKGNNDMDNLEWTTDQENIQHAYDNNLNPIKRGEDNHNATHTEKFIRKICEGLEKGLSLTECAEYVGMEPTRQNRAYISRIKRKDCWAHVSDEYNIPEESYGTKRKFTDAQIHKICWDIMDGLSDNEILDKLIPNIKGPERSKYQKSIYKIRHKIGYNDITDFYDF